MTRRVLPNRRHNETVSFEFNGGKHCFTVSRFDDGSVAEVFTSVHYGAGAAEESYARDAAIILSLALQYGASLAIIRHAITRDDKSRPATLIGAIVDALE